MNKIYKLIHNGIVVYVGKTKRTLKRRKSEGYKTNLAVQLIYKDCDIILIEETSDVSRERYWIDYYKDTVLNIQRGNTGLSHKERAKEWRESNREDYNQYRREYRLENKSNKEYMREYMREYRLKNKLNNGITNF